MPKPRETGRNHLREESPWKSPREQEMRAAVQEQRARVVEAEALVPTALAEAFRNGQLGVLGSYNLRTIQADTQRRPSLGGGRETGSTEEM